MKQKCVVVIPVYKEFPSAIEQSSFRQGLRVLSSWDIVIITYQSINLFQYNDIAKEVNKEYKIEFFEQSCFSSVSGYNKLCLSIDFYRRFLKYKYILIYQLDAWVFKDCLKEWCDKGYDYIGAPFFIYSEKEPQKGIFTSVGNGGFSLRRTQYCIDVLSLPCHLPFLTPQKLIKQWKERTIENNCLWWKCILLLFWYIIKATGIRNTLDFYKKSVNEDYLFSDFALESWYISPNIPTVALASKFSFEKNPALLFRLNGNRLPFGCHAFAKYEYDSFWVQHISLQKNSEKDT